MKRFAFRLQRVLQLREIAEAEQARRLVDAQRAFEDCQALVDACGARVAEAALQLSTESPTGRTVGMLSSLSLLLDAARATLSAAEAATEQAGLRVTVERGRFDEARQARRAIERLREQRLGVWTTDVNREEQQAVDDVALRRYQRGGNA